MGEIVDLRQHAASSEFDLFWLAYPKQYGIGTARRQWIWALGAAGNDANRIIEGAMAYARHVQREGIEWAYILAPAKWLAGEHWNDVYSVAKPEPEKTVSMREIMEAKAAAGSQFARDWLKRNS
jgi:hypothetical protein